MANDDQLLKEAYSQIYKENILQQVGDFGKRIGALQPDADFYSRERSRSYKQSVARQAEEAQKKAGSDKINLNLDLIREKLDQMDSEFSQDFPIWSKIKQEFNGILNKYRK